MTINWANVTVKLSDLQPWEHNPRTMTKRQAQRLLKSWDTLGQFQTIAIGPHGEVYDGHQRLNALFAAHGPSFEIEARQCERELNDDERAALTLAANIPAGAWDWGKLAQWDAGAMSDWGMDKETLATWNSDAANLTTMLEAEQLHGDAAAEPQIDRAAELNEKWQVQCGDLWRIGAHRLLCGDSTKREDVEKVMRGERADFSFTDPPYNVGVKYQKETDDKQTHDNFVEWCKSWAQFLPEKFCITVGVKRLLWWRDILGDPLWTIAWIKKNGQSNTGLGGTNKWDPILVYGCKPDNGIDIIEVNNDYSEGIVSSGDHPTPKPPELWKKIIDRFTDAGAIVSEYFTGTGTTLVACQNLQRKCRAIEISPNYCAVILERMATAFPGIEIERVES